MLNGLWAFMMLIGLVWAAFHGNLAAVTEGAVASAGEAVTLCLSMLGIMSFWTGILEVGRRAGLIEQLSRGLRPILTFLFPRIPAGHPALQSISVNMIANMLGLGWAATPAGLKAMQELEELEEERRAAWQEAGSRAARQESGSRAAWQESGSRTVRQESGSRAVRRGRASKELLSGVCPVSRGCASDEMCTFLVVNISSLQLIPVNMIAYRAQYGSQDPMAVVGPALAATAVSTLVGILFCKIRSAV